MDASSETPDLPAAASKKIVAPSSPRRVRAHRMLLQKETEKVDSDTVAKHATQLAQAGVTGITVHGSNGEAVHFSDKERIAVIESTRTTLGSAWMSSMPLIVGYSAKSTRETVNLCTRPNLVALTMLSYCLLPIMALSDPWTGFSNSTKM